MNRLVKRCAARTFALVQCSDFSITACSPSEKSKPSIASHHKALLIIGAGELGTELGAIWLQRYPNAQVIAETQSRRRHDALSAQGLQPRCASANDIEQPVRFANVVLCVPPGKSTDYDQLVKRAVGFWNGNGAMVFTSSGSVFAENKGRVVNETSLTATLPSERQQKLLAAEAAVIEGGGNVVRLAGGLSRWAR